ncbi:MAG: transketolase [Deltaproteobacteria bacterium]|nr:transketolase [Deltaproteobacteria bacterium]
MRPSVCSVLSEACARRREVVLITGDAGYGVFNEFQERFSDRFLNLGIAEQFTTSFAAGLCLAGFRPVLYNIIPFLLYRPYEQVRNDVCTPKMPVVMVGTGAGVTYAPQGMSHYALEDLGLAQTLPGLTVFSPADPLETKAALRLALESEGPVYLRITGTGEPDLGEAPQDIRLPRLLAEGSDLAVLCHGPITTEALGAREIVAKQGLSLRVISVPCIQPLATDWLWYNLGDLDRVLVLEEHFSPSGLAGRVQDAACAHGVWGRWSFQFRGVPQDPVPQGLNQAELRRLWGLDAQGLAQSIAAFMRE